MHLDSGVCRCSLTPSHFEIWNLFRPAIYNRDTFDGLLLIKNMPPRFWDFLNTMMCVCHALAMCLSLLCSPSTLSVWHRSRAVLLSADCRGPIVNEDTDSSQSQLCRVDTESWIWWRLGWHQGLGVRASVYLGGSVWLGRMYVWEKNSYSSLVQLPGLSMRCPSLSNLKSSSTGMPG